MRADRRVLAQQQLAQALWVIAEGHQRVETDAGGAGDQHAGMLKALVGAPLIFTSGDAP